MFSLFLQVAICITCVILQAKSEENAENRELDEEFEGTYKFSRLIISCSFVIIVTKSLGYTRDAMTINLLVK